MAKPRNWFKTFFKIAKFWVLTPPHGGVIIFLLRRRVMETIDKIKRDAEKKNISIPLVKDDYVTTTGSELYGTLNLVQTENPEDTISSVDALYYVLKEQYGQEFANRVLKRVYDRAQPFASKNATVDLLANANKKATATYQDIELLTMLNSKRQAFGILPPDKAPFTKLKVNLSSKKYKGAKCCYVPKMCMNSLAGHERKYIAIDLRPATAAELKDFLSELEAANTEAWFTNHKFGEEEFGIKREQIAMLGLLLASYHDDKNKKDGGLTEIKIYEILASLMRTEVLPKPKRIFISKPNEDEGYEPATEERDIDAVEEIKESCNKILLIHMAQGKNIQTEYLFSDGILKVSGYDYSEEIPDPSNERQ